MATAADELAPPGVGVPDKSITNLLDMQFVKIPAGEFQMGITENDAARLMQGSGDRRALKGWEKQVHKVRLTNDHYIGKHEVTAGQFRTFVEATQYETNAEDGFNAVRFPIIEGAITPGTWRDPRFKQDEEIEALKAENGVFGEQQEPPKRQAADLGGGVKLELALIPAGKFKMGSGESAEETAAFFNKTYRENFPADGRGGLESSFFGNEHPQHEVSITKPFFLGIYPITRGQFRQFVTATTYMMETEKGEKRWAWGWDPDQKEFSFNEKYSWENAGFEQTDEHPVVNVTWNDAVAFCQWLSETDGQTYRLPTEAEWEYACRAGTTTRYPSGDDPKTLGQVGELVDAMAKAKIPDWKYMIRHSDNYVFTSPVGKSKPNAFGLYDMHGNAFQWCADWYGAEYYAASPAVDPTGPDSGRGRVIRGGTWSFRPLGARSAERNWTEPDGRNCAAGFRIARSE